MEQSITIVNRLGLHARAAAKLVECASRFGSQITITRDAQSVDAKSIMSVMLLAAGQGTSLKLVIQGEDAPEAMAALTALIADRFGEPD